MFLARLLPEEVLQRPTQLRRKLASPFDDTCHKFINFIDEHSWSDLRDPRRTMLQVTVRGDGAEAANQHLHSCGIYPHGPWIRLH